MNKDELKTKIEVIFKESKHQGEVMVAIYRIAFPDWDRIKGLHNWPTAGKELSDFIWQKFQAFDREHHPDVIAGGAWMNSGFNTDTDLSPWEINSDYCIVEYKEEEIKL